MKRFGNIVIARVSLLIFLAFLITFPLSCSKKQPETKEIKIAAILPLTGDGAAYGQKEKNGIELAIKQANDTSVINGRKIKTIYEDSQGLPAPAVAAIQRLISTENVTTIIGGAFSSPTLAIVPIANKNKIVLISPTASSPDLSGSSEYFFRVWPSDVAEGRVIAGVAVNKMKLRTFTILSGNNDYANGLKDVFVMTIKGLGGEVLVTEMYNDGDSDFRTQLSKIKEVLPDALYMVGYYKDFGKILIQAKEIGIKSRILSCGTFPEPEVLKIASDAAEGVVFAQPYFDRSSDDPAIQKYVKEYENEFKMEAGIYDAHAYDAAKVLIEAIRDGGESSDSIREALLKLKDFPGVTGNITFDKSGDVIKPTRIMTVRDGKFIAF